MAEDAYRLDEQQRNLVEATVVEHCHIRGWELFAVNCCSNHIHVVVMAKLKPESVRSQLKAWSTRKLKQLEQQRCPGVLEIRTNWWAERGSRRYINDNEGLETVIQYVQEAQDHPH